MRVVVVIVAAAASGCTFRASASTDASPVQSDAPDVAPIDGSPGVDAGLARAPCSAPNAMGLVACYEFDDSFASGTLLDSAVGHHDATTSGLSPATRGTSNAASVGSQAKTYAPQSTDFDLSSGYTMSMWIRPRSLPFGGDVYGLVDHENQYAMALVDDDVDGFVMVRCIHTNVDNEWVAMTSSSNWTFIACTYDGNNLCSRRFTSSGDHDAFCHSGAGAPNPTGAHGVAMGHLSNNGGPIDRFDGDIDSVQIYSRALSKADLCAVAAQPADCFDN